MSVLTVNLGERSYDIVVEPGALNSVGSFAARFAQSKDVCVIADERAGALYGEALLASFERAGLRPVQMSLPRGERSKSIGVVRKLLRSMARAGIGRDGMVVALGGGVAGDTAGFVASVYMRGVDFVQVPTTLLAQVDSSVGGKVAVNLPEGKNLVGAFHQPRCVVCDPRTLVSLPRREIRCGLAEALKHGFVRDAAYLERTEASLRQALGGDEYVLADIVSGSCAIKASIVAADERESGLRAILNFGHTLGHAVEAVGGYRRFRHGEAIAVGMVGAARLSVELGFCDESVATRVRTSLEAAGLPTSARGLDRAAVLAAMKSDKKARSGALRFVVLSGVGSATVTSDVPRKLLQRVIRELTP